MDHAEIESLHNIPYGLYVLTAKTNKINGCMINTLMQVASNPDRIVVAVNKTNYTAKMIRETGKFNVSILDNKTSFELIKLFGFSSGKDVDKFKSFKEYKLSKNGLPYITLNTNAYISAKVINTIDVGSHLMFVADIEKENVLAKTESLTYNYYLSHIKPKTRIKEKTVYVCSICGYVYDGDVLPEDFICPICKHGAKDFVLSEGIKKNIEKEIKVESKNIYYCPICGYEVESENNPGDCVLCGSKMELKN